MTMVFSQSNVKVLLTVINAMVQREFLPQISTVNKAYYPEVNCLLHETIPRKCTEFLEKKIMSFSR